MRTLLQFTTERGFTRAVSKVPFFNRSTALSEFAAWLADNNSEFHEKLFHTHGLPRYSARFGVRALYVWGEFLTTKTDSPGKKCLCVHESKFVAVTAEKRKKRQRNREERDEREERLKRLRTDSPDSDSESSAQPAVPQKVTWQ